MKKNEVISTRDANIVAVQTYLNSMYGHRSEWVNLVVDGATGTNVMQGIIRAFQIENGMFSITGTVGPITIGVMKSLEQISLMDPNGPISNNVALIQCALFCKGYNAGGITGIYYNAGVAAVSSMQSDAGLTVTGIIDWKVWFGLLSLNWFTLTSTGSSIVRTIQQELNKNWSNIIGVGPCDGIVSRITALSLIGALQAQEGVTTELITDLNQVNFGEATTTAFPRVLKDGQNSDFYIPYNKIAQFGLFFNGFNPGNFNGTYDATMASRVTALQEFFELLNLGIADKGEINVSVMKSLLTSKGDTSRQAKACDCATVLNQPQALSLAHAGYTHVGRYLTGSVGEYFVPKNITIAEISNIKSAGLKVFLIYQDGGYYLGYFKKASQGINDARLAIDAANTIGVPNNSTIYFAVDFDCLEHELRDYIIPYFADINTIFRSNENNKNYRVGIYAPRLLCTRVSEIGLAIFSFVANMSTGFSGNLGFPMPTNWTFDQFYEFTFSSNPSFPLDKDAYSGRDVGVSEFDTVSSDAEYENARRQFILGVMSTLGYLENILNVGISYDVHRQIANYATANVIVNVTAKFSTKIEQFSDSKYTINVNLDSNGELSANTKQEIDNVIITGKLEDIPLEYNFANILSKLSLTIKSGKIFFKAEPNISLNQIKITIGINSNNLLSHVNGAKAEVSMEIVYTITFIDINQDKVNAPAFSVSPATVIVGIALVGVIIGSKGLAIPVVKSHLAYTGVLISLGTMSMEEDNTKNDI